VIERVDAGGRHVGVVRQIPLIVEVGVRIAPLFPAVRFVVDERVDTGRRDVGIVLQIVDVVEAVGRRP